MYIKSYKELIVWQKSIGLAKEIYTLTEHFPKTEMYGLTAQTRRSTVSIASNIAEGYGRKSKNEFHQFCAIAYGSVLELETQLILAKELKMAKPDLFSKSESLLEEISKMLNTILYKIRVSKR